MYVVLALCAYRVRIHVKQSLVIIVINNRSMILLIPF